MVVEHGFRAPRISEKPAEMQSSSEEADTGFHKLSQENRALVARLEDLEKELQILRASRSWKLTAPLRSAKVYLYYFKSLIDGGCHTVHLQPPNNLERITSAATVSFKFQSSLKRPPRGCLDCKIVEPAKGENIEIDLYYDCGSGFSEERRCALKFKESETRIFLPRLLRELRFDVIAYSSPIRLVIKEVNPLKVWIQALKARYSEVQGRGENRAQFTFKLIKRCLFEGWYSFKLAAFGADFPATEREKLYASWQKKEKRRKAALGPALHKKSQEFRYRPLISILLPVYNPPETFLYRAIQSVQEQIYPNWELCVADDASSRPSVSRTLEKLAAQDGRIKIVWREKNGHIAAASNNALEIASGEYIALLDHDDELSSDALYQVVAALNNNPQLDLLYSDEDRMSEDGKRMQAYFKPDWNYDLFLNQNLISHLGVYRTSIAKQIGGFRVGFEGSQDWDFALRFVAQISPKNIKHIPEVLYHWRLVSQSFSFSSGTKVDILGSARAALTEHLQRRQLPMQVISKVGESVFTQALEPELRNRTALLALEAPSSALQPLSPSKFALVKEISQNSSAAYDLTFVSEINDFVKLLDCEFVLIVGGELSFRNPSAINQLLCRLTRDEVAAAGGMICQQSGRIIHAGYVLGGADIYRSALRGLRPRPNEFFGRSSICQEVSAISLICAAFRRDCYLSAGGLRANLGADLAAIDLCLRLRSKGKKVLFEPAVTAIQASTSLQHLFPCSKSAKSQREAFKQLWPDAENLQDPFYNPNLDLEDAHFLPALK